MRLLRRTKTGFTLKEFPPDKIPTYAILSHTWGRPAEEVTMKDLVNGTARRKKAGYKKIKFCYKEASRKGLQYFWVDTCCIDKTNQAELTESLVSMYQWYQKATVCFVYLTDVNSRGSDKQPDPAWDKDFRNSRWFKRGWTLQELLAPETVEFFSNDRVCLGNKRSLEQQIHEVTGISIEALRCKDLSQFTVEERFRWTESRVTSREEDLSYCLLGIFGVSMSVIYAEGKDSARRRLRRKIAKLTNETTVEPSSQSSQANKRPFVSTFERNPGFTGRGPEMKRLCEMLPTTGRTMKIAITGLGGIGKTQLALEFVFQHKELPDCAVFWISCVSSETIDQAYRAISRKLGIPGHDDAQLNVKELLRDYLSSDKSGRWLLVFDNVDDLSVWEDNTSPSSRGLLDYLPKNDLGTIIFTSRDNKTAFKLASPNVVNLSEMDESTSRQLLQNYLRNKDLVKAEEDTRILLERLAYLPLAIVQAASFINMNQTTLQDYIRLLDKQEHEQIELLNKDFDDDWRYQSGQNPVARTWLISFTQIKQRDPLALDFLSFMACIDSKDIPRSLLPCPSSLPEAREVEAIGTLAGYSFITKHTTGNAFSMHRLVHIATRNWLRVEKALDTWTDKAVTRLADALLEPDQTDRAQWRSCMPHAHYILTLIAGPYDYNSHLFMLFQRYGHCLDYEGRYKEAEINYEELVKIFKTTLGADHPDTLTSMSNLALVYERQGRWDKAEKLGAQVVEARKTKLGADHPDTLASMSNLASVYERQGRWDKAEKLGAQVVEARKTKLGADHPDTLTSMSNLALVYWNQGRWDKAEKLGAQVVEARKTKLGADHPDTLTSMSNLALVYWNQGRWDEAEKLGAQVVEARKTKLGADHPDTLTSMSNLALVYCNQGRWDKAEKLGVQEMEACKAKLGADHPDTLTSMSNLALVYERQGRWDEAEKLGVQEIEACKAKLGADHPDTLTSMSNLALVYERQGRWDEAEKLGVQEIEACKAKLGADHPDTLTSMNNVAIVWKKLDRHADALKLMQSCVEAQNRVLGPNHPYTKDSAAWLKEWEE